MLYFKKSMIYIFWGLLFFSVSAFSVQFDQKLSSSQPNTSIQISSDNTSTPNFSEPVQPTSIGKNQKNIQPTKTPKPTSTPPVIPPPADPGATSVMIILAVFMVTVILFGFWLNRKRIF